MSAQVQIPGQLTDVYTTEEINLGTKYELAGRTYQFAYFDDAVNITAGMILALADRVASSRACTPDRSGGSGITFAGANNTIHPVAGIAMAAATVATQKYGWIQIAGPNAVAMLTDGNVIAGSRLVATDVDGECGLATSETDGDPLSDAYAVFGVALAADTGTSLAIGDCILDCMGI